MPHGLPDDSNIIKARWTYNLDDMAELAARTGGSMLLDRLGDTVYRNTFTEGLKNVIPQGLPLVGAVQLTGESTIQGGVAVKLFCPAGVGNYALILLSIYRPLSAFAGYEWAFVAMQHLPEMAWYLYDYHDPLSYRYGIRWNRASGGWDVLDATTGWTQFYAQAEIWVNELPWWRCKVVLDITGANYLSMKINDNTYDLSAYDPVVIGPVGIPHHDAVFGFESDNVSDGTMLLDDINVTQNELVP